MTITVRGSNQSYVNNSSSGSVSLPAGSAVGDMCYVIASHGFDPNSISSGSAGSWAAVDNLSGSFYNGACWQRVLSAADISSGTVTVGFAGTYYGTISVIVFVGSAATIRTFADQRSSTGAASRTVTTGSSPQINDYAVYYGAGRAVSTVTSSLGTSLQSQSNTESSSVLAGGLLTSAGAVSDTFSFSATPSGDYEIVLILKPVAPPNNTFDPALKTSTTLSNFNTTAVSTGAGGARSSRPMTGKTYFEFIATTVTGTPSCGICSSSWNTSTALQSGTNSLAYLASGAVQVNGTTLSTIATWAQGNRIGVAVDPASRLVWFRVNGGNWNNGAGNDPGTGTGGIDYSSAMTGNGTLLGAVYASASGEQWDVNFDSSTWVDTAPTGYSDIGGCQYVVANNVDLSYQANPISAQYLGPVARAVPHPLDKYVTAFSPAGALTAVSGVVEENSVVQAGKWVEVYDRNTGELIGRTQSSSDGTWSVYALGRLSVRVVCSDPTTYNSLVYDNVTPV